MDGAKNRGKCIAENCTTSSHLNVNNPPDHKFVAREDEMNRLMTAITDATCGEACWSAREDVCRCSCSGANHGITRTGGVPERTSKIDGLMYKLTAVGPEREIEQQARDMLKSQIKSTVIVHTELTFTYFWKAKDRRSPVRTRPATASQIDRWHELAFFKANPVAAYDWHNAPSLLWERMTSA